MHFDRNKARTHFYPHNVCRPLTHKTAELLSRLQKNQQSLHHLENASFSGST